MAPYRVKDRSGVREAACGALLVLGCVALCLVVNAALSALAAQAVGTYTSFVAR